MSSHGDRSRGRWRAAGDMATKGRELAIDYNPPADKLRDLVMDTSAFRPTGSSLPFRWPPARWPVGGFVANGCPSSGASVFVVLFLIDSWHFFMCNPELRF